MKKGGTTMKGVNMKRRIAAVAAAVCVALTALSPLTALPVYATADTAVAENPAYYAAILNWDLSLADIKLLCHNSLTHGGLSEEETKEMLKDWEKDWAAFVEKSIG